MDPSQSASRSICSEKASYHLVKGLAITLLVASVAALLFGVGGILASTNTLLPNSISWLTQTGIVGSSLIAGGGCVCGYLMVIVLSKIKKPQGAATLPPKPATPPPEVPSALPTPETSPKQAPSLLEAEPSGPIEPSSLQLKNPERYFHDSWFPLALWAIARNNCPPNVEDLCKKIEFLYDKKGDDAYVLKKEEMRARFTAIQACLKGDILREVTDKFKSNFTEAVAERYLEVLNKAISLLLFRLGQRQTALEKYPDTLNKEQYTALTDELEKHHNVTRICSPFLNTLESIHYQIGIRLAFSNQIRSVMSHIKSGIQFGATDEAEKCRSYLSQINANFYFDGGPGGDYTQKNIPEVFKTLFKHLFYDFTSGESPLMIREIPFLKYDKLASLEGGFPSISPDGVMISPDGKWVLVGFTRGGGGNIAQQRIGMGHYTSFVYDHLSRSYLELDNLGFRNFHLAAGLDSSLWEVEVIDGISVDSDQEGIWMDLDAFNRLKDSGHLVDVSKWITPSYQQNNCYLASSFVQLTLFQAIIDQWQTHIDPTIPDLTPRPPVVVEEDLIQKPKKPYQPLG